MKKIISIVILGAYIVFGPGAGAFQGNAKETPITISDHFLVDQPLFIDDGYYLSIHLNDVKSYLLEPGKPLLPVINKVFTFPSGTEIVDVNVEYSIETYVLSKKIVPCSPQKILDVNNQLDIIDIISDNMVYFSDRFYPEIPVSFRKGEGLHNDDHLYYLLVKVIPQYNPRKNQVHIPTRINIDVDYLPPKEPLFTVDEYDMVIIAPAEFSPFLQPIIDHKNGYGLKTFLKTTEEIYIGYKGRDKAEQIKYFIKDAIDTFGIVYVMLVGSIHKLPMRIIPWDLGGREGTIDMLVDLYYSDIYDSNLSFCNWDKNMNAFYGESVDEMDFYPDVHLGRLACNSVKEVTSVVQKIVNYETYAFGSSWFNHMISMAGDTFPEERFPGATGREGEQHTMDIIQIMKDFNHTTLWTSKKNFNRRTISTEISKGAGFLFYSGHGFPNGLCPEGGSQDWALYYTSRLINELKNGYKLPIVFLTACSTAKLDYSLHEFLSYYLSPSIINILDTLPWVNKNQLIPCFAWNLVKHPSGGAIATVGSTHFILSSEYGSGGCYNPPYYFFRGYNQSERLGEMVTEMVNENINDITNDEHAIYTIEQHILLGDPSLKIGGYNEM